MEGGRIQLSQKNYPKAMQTFTRVIALDESNYEAWYFRGLTKFYQQDITGAEKDLDQAIIYNPAVAHIYLIRGVVRDMLGDLYGALEDYNAGLAIDPNNSNLYYSRGTTRLRLNNYSLSIEDFNEAIRVDDRMTSAYLNRGVARSKLFNREGAVSDFNQAILLNPFRAEGHNRKGLLFYEMGKYQEALVSFGEAIQRDSANPQQFYVRALTWSEMGHKDSCLIDLGRVLERDSRHSLSYYNRAIIRSQIGDYEGAIADYLTVNEIHPYHVLSYFNRGLLRDQTGDQLGALFDLDYAVEIFPDFAKAYQVRASIKRKLGDDLGAQTDLVLANEKIKANAGRSQEELALNYADTSYSFEDLIGLNSVFNHSFNADNQTETGYSEMEGPFIISPRDSLDAMIGGLGFSISRKISISTIDSGLAQEVKDHPDISFELNRNTKNLLPDEALDNRLSEAIGFSAERDFNQGISLLDELIRESVNEKLALFVRAQSRFEMIEFVRATSMINEVVPMQVMGDPIRQSRQLIDRVDYSEIIADYDRLLLKEPSLAIVYYNRGLVKVYDRDYQGAIRDFDKAVELAPGFSEAWLNLGLVKLKTEIATKTDNSDRKENYADNVPVVNEPACLALSKAGELGLKRAYQLIQKYCRN